MSKTELQKLSRRKALHVLGAAGAALTVGCNGESPTSPTTTTTDTSSSTSTGTSGGSGTTSTCAVTPEETAGPYPSKSLIFRSDITEGKSGTPLNLTITVVNVNSSCAAVANATVEIWHCDATGYYSEYTQQGYNGLNDTYLRGAQTTDANGRAVFTSIYPGWYQGRATHIHVEVYVNGRSVKTSQIAFPANINSAVYSEGVYASKGQNPTSNSSDGIFSDGVSLQTATIAGSPSTGYIATWLVGISV
jgi:protocatechuate 3,4-dioxygenase beta subunit